MFNERLKLARKREGLSLRGLAIRIGSVVSAQAIGKYERGEMMPSSTVSIALSKALGVSMSYLLSPSKVSLEGVEFRKLASTKIRVRAMVEGAVLDHVDRYLQIEDLLGFACSRWKKPEGDPFCIHAIEDAERAAQTVRTAWNLDATPIPDMTELLEERGIKVLKLDFPLSVDGLTCNVPRPNEEDVSVIVCNTNKTIERQRFTLAHEMGHMYMRISGGVQAEKACDRFAGAFLVPKKKLFDEVGQIRHTFGCAEFFEIKQMFGVSAAMLVVRLRDLKIIKQTTLRFIFSGIGRTWRREEPSALKRDEPPKRFHRLCYRALAENNITASKAAELLGLSVREIERKMSGSASG